MGKHQANRLAPNRLSLQAQLGTLEFIKRSIDENPEFDKMPLPKVAALASEVIGTTVKATNLESVLKAAGIVWKSPMAIKQTERGKRIKTLEETVGRQGATIARLERLVLALYGEFSLTVPEDAALVSVVGGKNGEVRR